MAPDMINSIPYITGIMTSKEVFRGNRLTFIGAGPERKYTSETIIPPGSYSFETKIPGDEL